jgi:hypothetical protein
MKTKIIILVALVGLVAGCDQVTLDQVQGLAGSVKTLNTSLDQYQATTDATLTTLKDQKVISEEAYQKVVKIGAEIDKVQTQTQQVATAIQAVKPTGDQVQDAIAVAKAANQATAPFNPYSGYIDLGLGLAAGLAGLLWRKTASQLATTQEKYDAHKAGAEAARVTLSADPTLTGASAAAVIFDKIGEARANIGVK